MKSLTAVPTSTPVARDFARPGFARLIEIELRKAVDTRAGFWLLLATLGLTVVAAVVRATTGSAEDHTFRAVLEMALVPTNVLLPVVGILLITSEWSQRTALSTFALTPARLRLVAAKCSAGVVVGLAFFLFALIVSASCVVAFSGDVSGAWAFGIDLSAQFTLFVIIGMMMGLALGAACLASAPAIVLYFAGPTVVTILSGIRSLEPMLKWVDPAATSIPLTAGPISSTDASHLLTATLVWVVLPLTIGIWRIRRADIE